MFVCSFLLIDDTYATSAIPTYARQARKNGFALLYLVGKGTDKDGKEGTLLGSIRIPGDPGYQETAKMIGETGACMRHVVALL